MGRILTTNDIYNVQPNPRLDTRGKGGGGMEKGQKFVLSNHPKLPEERKKKHNTSTLFVQNDKKLPHENKKSILNLAKAEEACWSR